jgi:predicted DNA-binding transcriptional regulator YafY
LSTSARLLRLLSLLQARRFWAGAELAQRLEVTSRTLRRDVDRLRELGYPVNAASGKAGGYRLGAGAALPPLLLSDDEALAVAVGLRTAATGTVSGMEESAVRALAKLEQVLPTRLRRRVSALGAAVMPLHAAGPRVDPGLLSAIAAACGGQQELRFRYTDTKVRTSERTVEPYGLVHASSRWYLVAYCLERNGFRTFRVDRIAAELSSGRRFVPRAVPDGSPAAFVARSISSSMYRYQAKIVLHAPLEAMSERISPLSGSLKRIDAERCVLETGAHSLSSIALYMASLEVDFEVLEPDELREMLQKLALRLRRAIAKRGAAGTLSP